MIKGKKLKFLFPRRPGTLLGFEEVLFSKRCAVLKYAQTTILPALI
jgi:hypothetical protein